MKHELKTGHLQKPQTRIAQVSEKECPLALLPLQLEDCLGSPRASLVPLANRLKKVYSLYRLLIQLRHYACLSRLPSLRG